ncbi:MAG: flagellar hook-basal body complex protein [Verrucomicrobiae bacterium]|nr:flagellar hook-basal body complex protein [Verrucomicrobiae bacterium]
MLRSLTSAISGLQNFQGRLDVIGNNIANVNTTGFKAARVDFADSFSQTLRSASAGSPTSSGTSSMQVGSGVTTAAIRNLYTQGAITGTNVKTDLAVAGEGYFVVRDALSNSNFATRAGDFRLDGNGHLVTNGGMRVQGYNDSKLSGIGDIKIDLEGMLVHATPPRGSSLLNLDTFADLESFALGLAEATDPESMDGFLFGQLSADTQAQLAAWKDITPDRPPISADLSKRVVDDLNAALSGPSLWKADPDDNKHFDGVVLRDETRSLLGEGMEGEKLARMNRMLLEDAYGSAMAQKPLPTLASYAIDTEGRVNINLSDGSQFVRGQVLLQNFRDPQSLVKEGNNLYSGITMAGPLENMAAAGTQGLGRIQSGALELSNVDLANEFSTMITAQRAFQATARVISVSDDMLQELVNLKR